MPTLLDSLLQLPEGLRAGWTSTMDDVNKKRAELRDTLAFALTNPGGGAEGDPQALATHEGWMSNAAEGMSETFRPGATEALLDLLGMGNEAVSGSLAWLGGHGFYGPTGYDPQDVEANRRGIAQGLLRGQSAPDLVRPFVPIQRQ